MSNDDKATVNESLTVQDGDRLPLLGAAYGSEWDGPAPTVDECIEYAASGESTGGLRTHVTLKTLAIEVLRLRALHENFVPAHVRDRLREKYDGEDLDRAMLRWLQKNSHNA